MVERFGGESGDDPLGVQTVDRRFADIVAAAPDLIAASERGKQRSYGELAALMGRVRAGLEHKGVRHGDAVGVCMDRGTDLLAVLLGVLACGAAYVPLDGRHPAARLEFMVRDVDVVCVVCDSSHASRLAGVTVPVIDVNGLCGGPPGSGTGFGHEADPDDVAYIMYTSGSTGQPKSVELTHRNLAGFLDAMSALLPSRAARRVLFNTPLTFDIAGLEIFFPLVNGGTCVVAPQTWLPNMNALAKLVNETAPTLVQATPVMWQMLLDAGAAFGPEQVLLCGGEALPRALAERFAGLPALCFNMYGPTEATIWATAWPIESGDVQLGAGLRHARVEVLGDDLVPVADGVEGEAYLAGPAVARGYRGRPRLTAERFLPDPWSARPGGRMYATGDIVRRTGNRLEWLRRRDTQIKLNGNRIELGEIEHVAMTVNGVRAAVALIVEPPAGAPALHLFVESTEEEPLRESVQRLRELLPAVMVPKHVHRLDALPLTANGKIDRRLLTTWMSQ